MVFNNDRLIPDFDDNGEIISSKTFFFMNLFYTKKPIEVLYSSEQEVQKQVKSADKQKLYIDKLG